MDRIETARQAKASGELNCAQAITCTFADEVGLSKQQALSAGAAFSAGMGCGQATCGALIGAAIILGIHYGTDRIGATKAAGRIMRLFAERNCGATCCWDLKAINPSTGLPVRPCPDCVADAATLLQEELSIVR